MRKVPREYPDKINTDSDKLVGTALITNRDGRENCGNGWKRTKIWRNWPFQWASTSPPLLLPFFFLLMPSQDVNNSLAFYGVCHTNVNMLPGFVMYQQRPSVPTGTGSSQSRGEEVIKRRDVSIICDTGTLTHTCGCRCGSVLQELVLKKKDRI